jgi:hypothetical protein
MKIRIHKPIWNLIMVLLVISLNACGGGGGGGGGGEGDLTVEETPYTGLTTPVTITSDNAETVMTNAFMGSSSIPVDQIVTVFSDANSSNNYTVSSKCGSGGYAKITIDDNSDINNATGNIEFSSFCMYDIIFSGTVSFHLIRDQNTNKTTFDITYSGFKATYDSYSFTTNGTVKFETDFNMTFNTRTITYNIYLTDDIESKTYWFKDYVIKNNGSGVEINGRIYDPDLGYVDLQTVQDITSSSGVLVATGSNGTRARLTILSSSTYKVEADTDGDGVYDWDSGVL